MVSAPDYLSFIGDISKQWNYKNNNEISYEFGLDKGTLPALIRLNREWQNLFNSVKQDKEETEVLLKKLSSELQVLKNTDYEQLVRDLQNQVLELKQQLKEVENEYISFRDECSVNTKKSFFK
jgi:uncharacterized protein (DUF342 family)